MFEDLKKQIDTHNIISFDIFDTLIIRAYDKPTDLFKHIEISLKVDDFQRLRIEAEEKNKKKAYDRGLDETTIDEIYEELPAKLLSLEDVEVEQEINVCFQDKYMYEIYNYAKSQNKKVIITSDMYLNKPTIETILEKNGYIGYDKLFLSSDIKLCKASGRLFEEIIKQMNCEASDILHIGDNKFGDVEMPKSKGIKSFWYITGKQLNIKQGEEKFYQQFNERINSVPVSISKSLYLMDLFESQDIYESFGFRYAGLMTIGYVQWLKEQFDKNKINKVYFMSRDGYIPKQIFNIMYPTFETSYLYASRRAYLLSGMKDYNDISTYLTKMIGNRVTFDEYWISLHIQSKALERCFFETFNHKDIIKEDDVEKLDNFFKKNIDKLKVAGQEERENAINYLKTEKVLEGKVALVDIGWRGSVQNNIERTINLGNMTADINGYYLATHPFDYKNSNISAYLMNESKPHNVNEIITPNLPIFELIYSAPHAGVVKIDKKCDVVYQHITEDEQQRINVSKKILKGVQRFTEYYLKVTQKLPIEIEIEDCLLAFKNFNKNLASDFVNALKSVGYTTHIGETNNYTPIVPAFDKDKTIGVIYTWPGAEPNAEAEFLFRLLKTKIPYNIVPISYDGFLLNDKLQNMGIKVAEDSFKFIISIHYEDRKMQDAFYYHTLWNPPYTTLQYPFYLQLMKNIKSNDDYLIYDDGGMKNHLKSMLLNSSFDVDTASSLVASFPEEAVNIPQIKEPTLFYCGVNWEKMIGLEERHKTFFKMLDCYENVKFFGPQNGWVGYKNYQGKIPFDGFSLIDEIRKCGVVLALSSDYHYLSGAATNRVYEGCVAGAVIISDTNRFIMQHFGDSVLYIDFDKKHPERMVEQIQNHLKWIKDNPEQALEKARAAQAIFLKYFTLEKQLTNIINNHETRKNAVAKGYYSKNNDNVLVVAFIDDLDITIDTQKRIYSILDNIERQEEKNITLAFMCNEIIFDKFMTLLEQEHRALNLRCIKYAFYDKYQNRIKSKGQALYDVMHQIEHKYLMVLNGAEKMFRDHITRLKRTLEDHQDKIASYSYVFLDSLDGNRYICLQEHIKKQQIKDYIYPNVYPNVTGMFLMRSQIEEYLEDYMCQYVDGMEVNALLNIAIFNHNQEIICANCLTCGYQEQISLNKNVLVAISQQYNFICGIIQDAYEEWVGEIPYIKQSGSSLKDIGFSEHLLKWIRKIYRHKLGIEININKFLKLFIFSKKRRSKLKEKIKKLKAEKKQLKRMK